MDFGKTIGHRIKEIRKERGLSQTELAEKINKSLRTVQKYEKGEIEVSVETANDIANVLGTSIAFILTGEECVMNKQIEQSITDDVREIACPFCGKGSVYATILTTFYFTAEHKMYKTGVDFFGDSFGEIFGEPDKSKPLIKYTSFRCTSCGKRWINSQYKVVRDENGICSFVKQE